MGPSSLWPMSSLARGGLAVSVASWMLLPAWAGAQDDDESWTRLLNGFSVSLAYSLPLTESSLGVGSDTQGERAFNNTLSLTLKVSPAPYWFASLTFVEFLESDLQRPWNPDFTYSFGYNDWHPGTFSLTYSNSGGNRLNPDREAGQKYSRFEEGAISIGYKIPLAKGFQDLFTVTSSGALSASLVMTLVPRFVDPNLEERQKWKQSVRLSLKYTIYKWWYWNLTLVYYPKPEQQQPWDPDFTYGFGFFDWHPGTISVQYNNYSGNRYPWNEPSPGTGEFSNGSYSISWGWSF